jgi:hypothetical protein
MVVEDERRWPFGEKTNNIHLIMVKFEQKSNFLIGLLGLPKGSGKIKDISSFDANFFGIDDKEANLMDPQIRIMMELAYEAIWDAGN